LVAVSEELLADSAAMNGHLTRKMAQAVEWKTNDAIVNGTGAGMPLGILNAACLVAQAKEGSQAADTIVAGNIAKMYGRVIMGAGANVVWLMNPDCFQQVMQLSLNSNPIWVPSNQGFQSAPNGLLMGRPIILTDACDTVGDQGDIILANMTGYRAITKASGLEFATSMHLWFDQDLMAFRLTFRMDGQPALSAAVTPPNSAVTRSHFVALAART
jgi:HK97 family phage major capsid protein